MTALADEEEFWDEEALHEECGVFGMYDLGGGDVASSIYYGFLPFSTEARKAAELPSAIPRGRKAG